MKPAVRVFPGINRERDMARALKLASGQEAAMVWHAETSLPEGTDLAEVPVARGWDAGQVLRVPVAHGEGKHGGGEETVKRLEGEGRGLYRYCSADGVVDRKSDINGAGHALAGIVTELGNVLGMMPHP